MNSRNDMPDIEQALRDATHAYADQFEPAPDSWAQLRGRADNVTPRRRSRRWIFGIGGLAIATTTAAVLAITLNGDTDEAIDLNVPPATQPTTPVETGPFVAEGTDEMYAIWNNVEVLGVARFVRTGEPGADDEWTAELDVTFDHEYEYMFSGAYERVGLLLKGGEAAPEQTGTVDICSTEPPGADGRVTCTATFGASMLPGAVPFAADWTAGLFTVEAGEHVGITDIPVTEPVDADLFARFNTHPDVNGTAFFRREDDGETWTGWVDAWVGQTCWPPGAPAGGPDPCVVGAYLQVQLPSTGESAGAPTPMDVCDVALDETETFRCTGAFSGGASDTSSAFGPGSVALIGAAPVESFGTLIQADVVAIEPCQPAATLSSRIREVGAFSEGCASP